MLTFVAEVRRYIIIVIIVVGINLNFANFSYRAVPTSRGTNGQRPGSGLRILNHMSSLANQNVTIIIFFAKSPKRYPHDFLSNSSIATVQKAD